MAEKYTGKWVVFEDGDYVHIMPESDSRPHSNLIKDEDGELIADISDIDCPCIPRIEENRIVHHSFIDRKFLDEQLEKLYENGRIQSIIDPSGTTRKRVRNTWPKRLLLSFSAQ